MSKLCERCQTEIPDDFQNLLCLKCYDDIREENERIRTEAIDEIKKNKDSAINPQNIPPTTPIEPPRMPLEALKMRLDALSPSYYIKQQGYVENEEKEDKDQILANLAQFIYSHDPKRKRTGKLLWYPTRNMYNFLKNYCISKVTQHPQYPKFIWKPKIVDVGCGSGVGANVLSQEADFVWGIDKNEFSIEFAKEAFTREKNGIYYNPQLTFDAIDIMTENRTLMQFDMVVAIEVIEHIKDTYTFLQQIIRHFTKRDKKGKILEENGTEFFISTPNRNFKKLRKERPENPFHVREWASEEYYELLSQFFGEVSFMNNKGEPIPVENSADELIFAKCLKPKI